MTTVTMKKIMYVVIGFLILLTYLFFTGKRNTCGMKIDHVTIATVKCGPFYEYIPQTGIIKSDSIICGMYNVKVFIDELYLSRISRGLTATTHIDTIDYALAVTHVYPTVVNGRFYVDMNFSGDIPCGIWEGKSLRLRMELSPSSDEILLAVGSFYKDTGGKWIFVVENGDRVVRHRIKLGRKMGSEYFEVLEGLTPGDQVVTSSYEKFINYESLSLLEMEELQKS